MFDKVFASIAAAVVTVVGLFLTALMGLNWAALVQPLADLDPVVVAGLELNYGMALATALAASIPAGIAAAAAWWKKEFRGYGAGVNKPDEGETP